MRLKQGLKDTPNAGIMVDGNFKIILKLYNTTIRYGLAAKTIVID
ncbi:MULTISPECIES: hypothetical protein [Nostoc]|nr:MULTISPECIES: hypothetical protein [Nostoc]